MLVRDLTGKFIERRIFIEHVERVVSELYQKVGQYLWAWVPPPPKPKEGPSLGFWARRRPVERPRK